MVKVDWSRKAVKQILSIDVRYRKSISEKVNKLTDFPAVDLDIKKLQTGDSQYR
ncbi:type II toxin-antitoxin system RelE/ParE family toxin, partial [Yersinia enterocolitica]